MRQNIPRHNSLRFRRMYTRPDWQARERGENFGERIHGDEAPIEAGGNSQHRGSGLRVVGMAQLGCGYKTVVSKKTFTWRASNVAWPGRTRSALAEHRHGGAMRKPLQQDALRLLNQFQL